MTTNSHTLRHAIVGPSDDGEAGISDADWAAYSAGYEAGLREGIERTHLQITVELTPVGPANAGMRLWRAVTAARLTHRTRYPTPGLSGEELRERAHRSWGLTRHASSATGGEVSR
jgi:hypothetical protein